MINIIKTLVKKKKVVHSALCYLTEQVKYLANKMPFSNILQMSTLRLWYTSRFAIKSCVNERISFVTLYFTVPLLHVTCTLCGNKLCIITGN